MKYMLLIYNNPAVYESWSEEDRNRIFSSVDELMTELQASGEWVGGEALVDASLTKTVRVRDGVPLVTDGPFVEAKEQFAGYFMVDVPDDARAEAIAAQVSTAVNDRVELRGTLISA